MSGLKFVFDGNAEPGHRIKSVEMANNQPLDPNRRYTLATTPFLYKGMENYTMINTSETKLLIDDENAPLLPGLVRLHLLVVEVCNKFRDMPSASGVNLALNSFCRLINKTSTRQQSVELLTINPALEERIVNIASS